MAKKNDRLAERLAAIKSASPTITDVRIPEAKRRGPPAREEREPVFRPGKLYLSKTDHLRCSGFACKDLLLLFHAIFKHN